MAATTMSTAEAGVGASNWWRSCVSFWTFIARQPRDWAKLTRFPRDAAVFAWHNWDESSRREGRVMKQRECDQPLAKNHDRKP